MWLKVCSSSSLVRQSSVHVWRGFKTAPVRRVFRPVFCIPGFVRGKSLLFRIVELFIVTWCVQFMLLRMFHGTVSQWCDCSHLTNHNKRSVPIRTRSKAQRGKTRNRCSAKRGKTCNWWLASAGKRKISNPCQALENSNQWQARENARKGKSRFCFWLVKK